MFYELERLYAKLKAILREFFIHPYVLFLIPAVPYLLLRIYWDQWSHVVKGLLVFGSVLVPIGAIVLGAAMASSGSSDIRRGGLVVRFSAVALLVCVTISNGISQHSADNLLLVFLVFTAGYALKGYENYERREADNALGQIAQRAQQKATVIREYGKTLELQGPLFRQESELPFPKAEIRRELAEGLLRNDFEDSRHLAFGFTNLEFFLPPEEYAAVNEFVGTIWNRQNFELAEGARRGEDVRNDLKTVAEQIVGVSGHQPIWKQVLNRLSERGYQVQILKSISSGEADPNVRQLITEYDKHVDETAKRIRSQ